MANNLKELDVDVTRNLSQVSSEAPVKIKSVKTGEVLSLKQVSQGGINEYEYDVYPGPHEATPTSYDQTLQTNKTTLLQNITIHATPYSEVSNPEGGYTATIL